MRLVWLLGQLQIVPNERLVSKLHLILIFTWVLKLPGSLCLQGKSKPLPGQKRENCPQSYVYYCEGRGECYIEYKDKNNKALGYELFCFCYLEYYGKRCEKEKLNFCHKTPCFNGATCKPILGKQEDTLDFKCLCMPESSGTYCEIKITKCDNKLCNNKGNCTEEYKTNKNKAKKKWSCHCFPDYYGKTCQNSKEKACDDNPCKNRGSCISHERLIGPENQQSLEKRFSCICQSEFTGKLCENRLVRGDCKEKTKTCVHGHCELAHGEEPNYRSDRVEVCVCDKGYHGPQCDNKCKGGFYGKHCIKKCGWCKKPNKCNHKTGSCKSAGGCTEYYMGDTCKRKKTVADCVTGQENCRHGKCRYSSIEGATVIEFCDCDLGYQGLNCDQQCSKGYHGADCQDRCGFCKSERCDYIFGTCIPEGVCQPGYVGAQCKDIEVTINKVKFTLNGATYGDHLEQRDSAAREELAQQTRDFINAVYCQGVITTELRNRNNKEDEVNPCQINNIEFSRGSVRLDFDLQVASLYIKGKKVDDDISKAITKNAHKFSADGSIQVDPLSVQVVQVRQVSDESSNSAAEQDKYITAWLAVTLGLIVIMCAVVAIQKIYRKKKSVKRKKLQKTKSSRSKKTVRSRKSHE